MTASLECVVEPQVVANFMGCRATLVVGRIARFSAKGLVKDADPIIVCPDNAAAAGQIGIAQVAASAVDIDVQIAGRVPADLVVVAVAADEIRAARSRVAVVFIGDPPLL